jgi:integrase
MAAILDFKEVGGLVRAIRGYSGNSATRAALQLLALTFVRGSELRYATWDEFDLDGALWTISGPRMKKKRLHLVPLSTQAVDLLRAHLRISTCKTLLFPSVRSHSRPISENTINAALRRMGYEKSDMTGHGFRRTASTWLNEKGFASDWIEKQLAHVEENKVRGAYNAAEYLDGRRVMMQRWADWLDEQILLG